MFLSIEIYLLTFLEINKILSSIKDPFLRMPHHQKLGYLIKKNLTIKKGVHFYFVRHGQSVLNITNSVVGWTDCELSAKGKEQSTKIHTALREHVGSFQSYHTSDLQRCKETLILGLGLSKESKAKLKIAETSQLRELNFGDDEGLELSKLPQEYLKVMHSMDYKAPNGENWTQAR
jgi:broad specificity phosphatase PhoE